MSCVPSPLSLLCPEFAVVLQVGFLYIRYVANPRTLWEWIAPYVRDSEVCLLYLHTVCVIPARALFCASQSC